MFVSVNMLSFLQKTQLVEIQVQPTNGPPKTDKIKTTKALAASHTFNPLNVKTLDLCTNTADKLQVMLMTQWTERCYNTMTLPCLMVAFAQMV